MAYMSKGVSSYSQLLGETLYLEVLVPAGRTVRDRLDGGLGGGVGLLYRAAGGEGATKAGFGGGGLRGAGKLRLF
jgi:hypothetical protein